MSLVDQLLAVPISIIYWWHGLRDRCPESPDGRHWPVVKDAKYQCKYCGKPTVRVAPGADGIDR